MKVQEGLIRTMYDDLAAVRSQKPTPVQPRRPQRKVARQPKPIQPQLTVTAKTFPLPPKPATETSAVHRSLNLPSGRRREQAKTSIIIISLATATLILGGVIAFLFEVL